MLKVSNCCILVLSFLFVMGYLALLLLSDGHFIWPVSGDVEITWPGGQVHGHSLLQRTRRNSVSRSASDSLYATAVRGWCGLNMMCPFTRSCPLTQWLWFPHSHPSPHFVQKQNVKRCVCNGWCLAKQMSLQILMQQVQSPPRIFHLTVHCWNHDGTGKRGPLWLTLQCRR